MFKDGFDENFDDFLDGLKETIENIEDEDVELFELSFLDENSISEELKPENMPQRFLDGLDHYAARVLDTDSRQTIVIGNTLSGKTFMTEQLSFNIDRYLKNSDLDHMYFAFISENDMNVLGSKNGFHSMIKHYAEQLEIEEKNFCFCTDNVDVALYMSNVSKDLNIILELNRETFYNLIAASEKTASRTWNNWKVFDVETIQLDRDEIVSLMMNTVVKRVNTPNLDKTKHLTRVMVRKLVDRVLKDYPTFVREVDGKEIMSLPIGTWGVLVKYFSGVIKYTTDSSLYNKTGSPKTAKFLDKVMMETSEFISMYEKNRKITIDDFPNEILRILESENVDLLPDNIRVLTVGNDNNVSDKKEEMVFSDIYEVQKTLKRTIIGQDEAIDSIIDGLVVPAAGLNSPEKPLRSFLFSGPTGVGKTQTAIELSKILSTTELNMVRIDMSEFQQEHEVSKLFGAPPGYLGFEAGGMLTSKVKENPRSIVLLDEVEKAHPKIWDTFLQVLDSGRMTDGKGELVDFTECIIIMTSNIGVKEANKPISGFNIGNAEQLYELRKKETKSIVMKAIEREFRPEFINRIDEIIMFDELSAKSVKQIVLNEVKKVFDRLVSKNIVVSDLSDEIVEYLICKADISKYGAREIQRVIYKNITNSLAHYVVKNSNVSEISLILDNDTITVKGL